jgi:hypothetical protein
MPEGAQGMGKRYADETGRPRPPVRRARLRDQPFRRKRCDSMARKGTDVGSCDHWLDEHGQCANASNHTDEFGGE